MFRDFFELKNELLANGKTFTKESLTQLSYSDVLRAAIGDAGRAACDLELVEEERNARLNSTSNTDDPLLNEDLQLRAQIKKLEALPAWGSLSPLAQVYFRIRCLRAHADDPKPRLRLLGKQLYELGMREDKSPDAFMELYCVLSASTLALLDRINKGEILTVQRVREAYRGCEKIPRLLNAWERGICLNLTIQGYTCTGGCFIPSTCED